MVWRTPCRVDDSHAFRTLCYFSQAPKGAILDPERTAAVMTTEVKRSGSAHGGSALLGAALTALALGIGTALVGVLVSGSSALLGALIRSEEHTSELQSLMRISYAVFC